MAERHSAEYGAEDAEHLAQIRKTVAQCLEFGWEHDMFTTDDVVFLLRLIDSGPTRQG